MEDGGKGAKSFQKKSKEIISAKIHKYDNEIFKKYMFEEIEKWMLAQVPPHLAYGDDGAGDIIPGLS